MIYKTSLALFTDLYELTMAYCYWKMGMEKQEAVFHLFFRKKPFKGGYAIAAGLQSIIDFIENLTFDPSDLDYLSSLKDGKNKPLFDQGFIEYLKNLKFTCDVDAVEEGTLVFPYEPLVRISGPIIQAQILESALLNIINFQTLIATKASRICHAAKEDAVIEFGMRRAQGIDGALSATRASFIGGCESTSNTLAGKLYSIPVRGTMAHSFVMAFEKEIDSFLYFGKTMPNNSVFLIDTYDTIEGAKRAAKIAVSLKDQGFFLLGVRLDSGNLLELSQKVRKILDEQGLFDTKIMASNELDENQIETIKANGGMITIWGVGTHLVTAKDQPALDGVYKLSAIKKENGEWVYKIKRSEQEAKSTTPGILQVRRFFSKNKAFADAIYDIHTGIQAQPQIINLAETQQRKTIDKGDYFKDLLVPIFRKGKKIYPFHSLNQIQERMKKEKNLFSESLYDLKNPSDYLVGHVEYLHQMKKDLLKKIESEMGK